MVKIAEHQREFFNPRKKMAELGLKNCLWCSQENKLSTSFHFKIYFGFFLDAKLYDLGFH
jgi:hypothetical protein